jgi:hypothetical protein
MRQFSLWILWIAFVPLLAVAQPVVSNNHPPVHTVVMTGKNAITGDMTMKALHFCQSTGQMVETDYDSDTDMWSSPVPAGHDGPSRVPGITSHMDTCRSRFER